MSEIEIRSHIRQRGSLKAQVTNFNNHVSALKDKLNADPTLKLSVVEISVLKNRHELFMPLLNKFEQVQEFLEINYENEQELEDHYTYRNDFETRYYDTLALLYSVDNSFMKGCAFEEVNQPDSDNASVYSAASSNASHNLYHSVKLPTIDLPTFDGSIQHWLDFRETFNSLIHSSNIIDSVQKFHYLRASLKGEAAEIIKSFELSARNYNSAWDMLCERYDNNRLLVDSHVKALFQLEALQKESTDGIRKILDGINKHLRALKLLEQPTEHWDTLIIHIVVNKFDNRTLRDWEEFRREDSLPTLENLKHFMKNKADLLETIESKLPSRHKEHIKPREKHISKTFLTNNSACNICKGSHYTYNCTNLTSCSGQDRYKVVREKRLCINCLKPGHTAESCKSSTCRKCGAKHNTVLHYNRTQILDRVPNSPQGEPNPVSSQAHHVTVENNILLATAIVQIEDKNGHIHECRALLDNGSQSNFITETLAQKLNLKLDMVNHVVHGLNSISTKTPHKAQLTISARHSNYSLSLSCLVLPTISGCLPTFSIDRSRLNIPHKLLLADPSFDKSLPVDLLIGASFFWSLLSIGQIKLSCNGLVLQKTLLGWIISGPVPSIQSRNSFTHLAVNSDEISCQLRKFWEIENVETTPNTFLSKEESFAENHYVKHTFQNNQGRFVVQLPFKENPDLLGDSYNTALKRFYSLEKRLHSNGNLRAAYNNFMLEYEQMGHMSLVHDVVTRNRYYLPHHAVHKGDSITTKTRIVFDGSSKTSTGMSINDIQAVGPVIQQDLFSILLRFRQHSIAIHADIAKMYRQILIHKPHRKYQSILWRSCPSKPLLTYELNTVTYGTAAASFLSIRTLHSLAYQNANSYSDASQVILRDFYVDDVLTGADSVEQATKLINELVTIMKSGCLELRKWISNQPFVLEQLDSTSAFAVLQIPPDQGTKTLGLNWNPNDDTFTYFLNLENENPIFTKRMILSLIAQIFDPLGFLAPILISFKIFLQRLWKLNTSWDESLTHDLQFQWLQLYNQLPFINKCRLPRRITCDSPISVELHGFSDASESAFGGCLYLRSIDKSGNVTCRLLCSKTRVAPVKITTIPRLELCAALLLANLVSKCCDALLIQFKNIYYWTDSMIVLGWLRKEPCHLKTFVANRISQIQQVSSVNQWHHITSSQNPADLLSRGVPPNKLYESSLWWNGPAYLLDPNFSIPHGDYQAESLPEMKATISMHSVTSDTIFPFDKFSTLNKMKRIMSYVIRAGMKKLRQTSICLTFAEQEMALKYLIYLSQKECFPAETHNLSVGKPISRKSRILSLKPYLDGNLLRVGGRLRHSDYCFDKKHPIILDGNHPLTRLIFIEEHKRLLHAGPQLLLSNIRDRFWPTHGRALARATTRRCISCFKSNPVSSTPIMGDLPTERLVSSSPFENVGVDYAGPFLIKDIRGRGARVSKSYVCIFVCFTTKAIHIEIVTSLSTEGFLMALKRFIARRGMPKCIYSDNGTNFVGAASELRKLYDFLKAHEDEVVSAASSLSINWKFIPARSPHFGGLWEAAVKSFKRHLKRVTKTLTFTREELYTLTTQIEAVLNSRPLSPLSSDPTDLNPLTPAHLLIGRSLTSIPEATLKDVPMSRLSRYQHLELLKQHFWSRWSREYISELQTRTKWKATCNEVPLGALVLLKEDNVPPMAWRLGRIKEKHLGEDSVCRVVSVQTVNGVVKRSVTKVCALPLD